MLHVTEATFGRHVLRAPLPTLVCFGTRRCHGRLALIPAFEQVPSTYVGQLLVAMSLIDHGPFLAKSLDAYEGIPFFKGVSAATARPAKTRAVAGAYLHHKRISRFYHQQFLSFFWLRQPVCHT
jgi:hypothetical protein